MALCAKLLWVFLIFQATTAEYTTLENANVIQPLSRLEREAESSGDESIETIVCDPASVQVNLFTSVSILLTDTIKNCTVSPFGAYYEYEVNISSPITSTFTLSSQDDSVLFADHFSSKNTYRVNVEAICESCEDQIIELTLDISIQAYTERLLPFGSLLSDESLNGVNDNDGYSDVNFDAPFSVPVYNKRHRKAYINSNGLVSFEKPQTDWHPDPFPYEQSRVPILAPYWTDLDLTNSSVYYNTYYHRDGKRAETLLSIVSERVSDNANVDFSGQWMLTCTWSEVPLYLFKNQDKVITFQLVLVTDFESSYAFYLYDEFHIEELISALTIGHTAADFITYHNIEFASSDSYLHMDMQTGNTGKVGQWMFTISSQNTIDEDKLSCIQWTRNQGNTSWIDDLTTTSCPCTEQQANQDWRYSFDQSQRNNCAIFLPSTTLSTVECCYDDQGSLITSSEEGSGGYLRYHPAFYSEEYLLNDRDPHIQCCENSNNCEIFRAFRPLATCATYKAPVPGFAWGDPHFETFDGSSYTFNGLGEFVLLSSSANGVDIQVRMEQYQTTNASVIKAVAMKYKQLPIIQLEIDSNGDYLLYFNGENHSNVLPNKGSLAVFTLDGIHHGSNLSNADLPNENNLFLVNINDTYVLATNGGISVKIGSELTFLYTVLELGNEFLENTEGLMGFYDKDSSNDYRLPNGTAISDDTTEENLYSDFGLNWNVAEEKSLFTYQGGRSYTYYNSETISFTPAFGTGQLDSDPVLKDQAEAECNGDYSCLYDTAQTGNVTIGMATYKIRNQNKATQHELENFPPSINGSSFQLIVAAGSEYTATYTASDPDTGTNTEITIKEPVPEGIELNSTGHLSISITSLPSLPLHLTSSDANGTVTTQRVSVLLCDCSNNGTCVEDLSHLPLDSNGHYRLPCTCKVGFGGLYCEDDLRGCGQGPCPSYTTCKVNSSVAGGYECVDCDSTGYQYDQNNKCVDIDECAEDSDSCSQVCTNTDGSYDCSCNSGYRLSNDGVTCNDIDECLELTDKCGQHCINANGSYMCTCDGFWSLSADNVSCEPIESCTNCGEALCATDPSFGFGNVQSCVCPKGKRYGSSVCLECENGTFGFHCKNTCDCKNNGSCDPLLGCVCASGYTGYNCGTEINNYSPAFSSNSTSSIKLPEALPGDSSILYLKASDNETGPAGEVTYSIVSLAYDLPSDVSDGVDVFTINNISGLLRTIVPLADQDTKEYFLRVEAKDGTAEPNKDTHFLYIEVVNRTLPRPFFTSTNYQEYVHENLTKGSIVLKDIICLEEDSINPDVVELTIDIVSGNTNSTFEVVNNQIVTATSLDYEAFKSFDLQLTCTNALNSNTSANASVFVLNINDNPYKFDRLLYSIEAYENATTGNYLETFHASDADHPDFLTEYFLTSNLFLDVFILNKTTGVLSVGTVSPFDRETKDNYALKVTAYLYDEDSITKHTATADVLVTIKDLNDFIPLFSKSLYTVTDLSQSNAYNDTVLVVTAIDNDLGENGEIVYSIQSNDYFDIDPSTGRVFVNATFLDRGTYTLNLHATDFGAPSLTGSSVIQLYVKATPNEIYFTKNKYVFNVFEDAAWGLLAGTVEATLYDVINASIASELKYSIASGTPPILLKSKSGEILVYSSLDYEHQDFYEFKVMVFYPDDTSIPSATTTVQIIIEDVNDNSPMFVPSAYSTLLNDDSGLGTIVLTVHASDTDEDGTQLVTYTINDFDGPLDINSTSGEVFIKKDLGLPQNYHFTVTATDTGGLSSEAIVHVVVARRGAVHPLLNSVKIVFDIFESVSTAGFPVGTVKALINGNVTVASEHGISFRLKKPVYESSAVIPFEINSTSGEVTTLAHVFDYESQQEYVFYVELYDSETIYDSAPVVVKILDVNDESPMFEEEFYSGSISTTVGSGSTILTVSATDNDSGSNAEIRYSISSSTIGFHVDPFTGELITVNETHLAGDYTMSVSATDQGSTQKSSTVDVYVSVTNPTQNISFSLDSYAFTINENSPKDTEIGQVIVVAVNEETFVYSDLSFELFPASDCIGNNGRSIIVSCNNLDRETQAEYNITMSVKHLIENALGTVDIQVKIIDVNDNAPSFDRDIYTVVVSDDFNTTQSLLTPIVLDNDGLQSAANFTIDTSSPEVFVIDLMTGVVTMTTVPTIGDYSFKIIATDALDESLSNTATVLVSIFEPGPKTLEFSESSQSHSVAENSPGGTEIGILQLLAPGVVNPTEHIGNLDFSILSGDNTDYFHIVDSDATLTLLNNFLDREVTESHVILVRASFNDYELTAETYVTIEVTDKNDNAPKFTKSVYSASIPSNSIVGTSISVVSANDDDAGDNANVSYSLQGNETNLFNIDSDTGLVSTNAVLTADTHYILDVVATDGGMPPLSSTAVVSVFVEVTRPDSISFTLETYDFSIAENNALGSHVGSVAIAEDTEFLEGLVFAFVTPSDDDDAADLELFHLDAVTGNISALSSIDREEVDKVEVTVTAKVPDQVSLTASAVVKITILDENDHTPTFEQSIYLDDSLTEGSISTSTIILTVKAIDDDKDKNGEVTYNLSNEGDSDKFTISSSGDIKASSATLESGYYHITATATDGGATPLTGTAEVLITVYASIVNGISFQSSEYVFDVAEDTPPGTVLSDTSLKLKPINFDYVTLLQYTTDNQDFILVGNKTDSDLYSSISFDYDSDMQSYEFTATATAHITVGNEDTVSAVATITVNLVDVNDNAPQFTDIPSDGPYLTQAMENLGSNIDIMELAVDDIDSGSNGEIKCNLLDADKYSGILKISDNCHIRATGSTKIDRETDPSFLLTVTAVDNGSPSQTSTATVFITVLDENDNAPTMISSSLFYVPEERLPNTILFEVSAADPDNGTNGTVTYELLGGSTDYFGINSTSGEVYSKVRLDYEDSTQNKTFDLTVKFSDGGPVSKSEEETISVHLLNVPNDHKPRFEKIDNNREIYPNDNTTIVHVRAVDDDGDDLKYDISSSQFVINDEGEIRKADDVMLGVGSITITVTVTDDSTYELSSETTITITVVSPASSTSASSTSSSPGTSGATTSSSVVTASTKPPTVSSDDGSSGLIGFAIAGVFGILFVLALITIVIILVLFAGKRRERVKHKSDDPYAAAEENWILKETENDSKSNKKNKKDKKIKKKSKAKDKDIEMDRKSKSSAVDSSAYETMFEDDMIDLPAPLPWTVDPNYLADSEDNRKQPLLNFSSPQKPTKSKTPAAKSAAINKPPSQGVGASRLGLANKPPSVSKPGTTPSSAKPGTKPSSAKSGTTPSPAKPGVTKATPKSTATAAAPKKPLPKSTPSKINPPPKKTTPKSSAPPATKKGGSSAKPPSNRSSIGSDQSSPPRRRNKRASSIDSTADDLDTAQYLNQDYGSAKPMKPGERPSEYDFFLKPDDSGKQPAGRRSSLSNLGWN